MQMTEHLFEKWVRNLKTAYTAPVQDRKPQKNVYGVELPPTYSDIWDKIVVVGAVRADVSSDVE